MTVDEDLRRASGLRRAYAFMARGDMGGRRTEAGRFGVAVFDDDLPLRYDCNYLLVDALPENVAADDLAQDAERFDRVAVMVRDERTGERLAAGFGRLGWMTHRHVVMASHRPPERPADTAGVREVSEAALRPLRRAALAGEPWATPDVVAQLLDAKVALATRVRTRYFAVLADGQPVSAVDLYTGDRDTGDRDDRDEGGGRTAQIEDVATLPEHRGQGHASALVVHALGQAREAGCDLVFLVADAQDWPQELYRRLGFDNLGRYLKFIRPR